MNDLKSFPEIIAARELDFFEIKKLADLWLDEALPNAAKAETLTALAKRGETAAELAGFASAFLPRACHPGVEGTWRDKPLLDCCGTGGGGVPLLNVSTAMMFVLAGMGVPVVKHGNRAVTKSSGSADVLELLGIRLNLAGERPVSDALEKVGAAFLFAPSYHPAFAVIAPVRKQLGAQGQRTIFNLLGPLLNPARPAARLVGVFKKEQVQLYSRALQLMGCGAHRVVCGLMPNQDGDLQAIGEASAHGPTYWKFVSDAGTKAGTWEFHQPKGQLSELLVKDAEQSARLINEILGGECQGLARETVIINAAAAALTQGLAPTMDESIQRAKHAIDSGAALEVLSKWRTYSASI